MFLKIKILILGLCFLGPVIELYAADGKDQMQASSSADIKSLHYYQEKISTLESQQGAYHSELSKTLVEMGQWYRTQGDHLKAVGAFERALHISKVNKGMHNPAQVEFVELLIESFSTLRDWQSLGDNLHYLLWIHRRNYNAEDDRLVSMMERVGQWYAQAYHLHNGGEAVSYLVKADDLFDEAAVIIESQHGPQSRQLINILHSTAMINYRIANDVDDVFRMSHRDIREAMIPNKRASPYMHEAEVRTFYFNQSFHKGVRSLERIIDIYEGKLPESLVEYAQALVYQGDYYLSLKRKWNAMSNYNKAYAVLLQQGADSTDIRTIFGEPRQVEPFNIPGKEIMVVEQDRYVDAMFDVPGNGWPRNIRIIATSPEDNSELVIRGKHAVAATRFRPRFTNGKPMNTEGVSLRYFFRR